MREAVIPVRFSRDLAASRVTIGCLATDGIYTPLLRMRRRSNALEDMVRWKSRIPPRDTDAKTTLEAQGSGSHMFVLTSPLATRTGGLLRR